MNFRGHPISPPSFLPHCDTSGPIHKANKPIILHLSVIFILLTSYNTHKSEWSWFCEFDLRGFFFYILYFVDKATGVLIGYKCILILSMITATSVVTVN